MKTETDFAFMNQFSQAIYNWILLPNFNLSDLRLVYAFLCLLTRQFGIDATTILIPLMFKIQQALQEEKVHGYERRHCIETALINWLSMTADFYTIDKLTEYLTSLKEQRKDEPIFTEYINESYSEELEMFKVDDEEDKVDKVWVDRGTVVDLMSNNGNLRDESDPHGLNLEAKLFADWGSEAYRK
jgi:hypothetical protein